MPKKGEAWSDEKRQEMSEKRKQLLRERPELIEVWRGRKHSEESKAKISTALKHVKGSRAGRQRSSQAQIERYRREREMLADAPMPTHKKCAGPCGEYKLLEEFYTRKRKLKSGVLSVYPSPRCKECERERMKLHWQRLKEEGKAQEARRRKRESRDPEKERIYQREWSAAKRRRKGIKPRRLRRQEEQEVKEKGPFLPIGPIADLLTHELEGDEEQSLRAIAEATGLHDRRLYAIRHREYDTVSLRVVDAILTGLGRPEELNNLYPPEEEGKIVGYAYLDAA